MRIKDVMSREVLTVDLHEPLERARSAMTLRRVHHLVVVDGRNVVGLVSAELLAWGEAAGIARVEDVMFRHVVSGTPDLTIREAANLLRGRTVGALPILEGERLVGIVTLDDIAVRTGDLEVAQRMTQEVIEGALPGFFFHERG